MNVSVSGNLAFVADNMDLVVLDVSDPTAPRRVGFYEAPRGDFTFRFLDVVAVGTLGYYGAYGVIIYLTVIGHHSRAGLFTIGVLTFLAGSFRQSRDVIQRVLLSLSQVYEQSLYLDDLFTFLALEPRIRPGQGALAVPVPIRTGFVFENVGFRYPGADDDQFPLRNLQSDVGKSALHKRYPD